MSIEQPPQQPPQPSEEAPKIEGGVTLSEQERADFAVQEIRRLGVELGERAEALPFTGIDEASYATLKEDEEFCPPGYATPIDELIERFRAHGIKVVLNANTEPGSDTWVVPSDSTDASIYGLDRLLARHLKVTEDMDPDLKLLCVHSREYIALSKKLNPKK